MNEPEIRQSGTPEFNCEPISQANKTGYCIESHHGGPNFIVYETPQTLIDTYPYSPTSGVKVFHLKHRLNGKFVSVLLMIGYDLIKQTYRVIGINWSLGAYNTC